MSKLVGVVAAVLLGALVLSPASQAKSVSRYCTLLSAQQIGAPLGAGRVRTTSVTLAYPSTSRSARGRITLCSHRIPSDLIAQTSVARFTNAAGARTEFAAIVHREQRAGRATKTSGPWTDAYALGADGFVVLKGRFMFHIQYASGARGFSKITARTLAGLAARAVRKL